MKPAQRTLRRILSFLQKDVEIGGKVLHAEAVAEEAQALLLAIAALDLADRSAELSIHEQSGSVCNERCEYATRRKQALICYCTAKAVALMRSIA